MRNCWLKQVPLKMQIRILADSYQVNKTEYRVHVFIESLYNDTLESYSKNMQEDFVLYSSVFCKKKKNPIFTVVLCSAFLLLFSFDNYILSLRLCFYYLLIN